LETGDHCRKVLTIHFIPPCFSDVEKPALADVDKPASDEQPALDNPPPATVEQEAK
jgi:hypothetical protein